MICGSGLKGPSIFEKIVANSEIYMENFDVSQMLRGKFFATVCLIFLLFRIFLNISTVLRKNPHPLLRELCTPIDEH